MDKGVDSVPSVSPDGKRVAYVHVVEDDGKSLQVVTCDLDGKELHRSKPLERQETPNGRPGVFWVPGQPDRLLFDDSRILGFYDLKADKFTMHDKWGSLTSVLGGSPIRPDGKGFLGMKPDGSGGGKSDSLLFVDWDGKATKIQIPESADTQKEAAYWPSPLRWDDEVAVLRASDDLIRVDTKALKATQETTPPPLTADKKWIHDQFRLAGGAVVRLVELDPAHADKPPSNDKKPLLRVEVQKPDEKEAKTLMDDAEFAVIDPSPDGKMAVVQACSFSKTKGWLWLIDAKGEAAAKIDILKAP